MRTILKLLMALGLAGGLACLAVIEGVSPGIVMPFAGIPSSGTNAVQTLTVTATGGTYRLNFDGQWTTPLAFNANAAAIQAALVALGTVGASGIVVTGTGPWTLTFGGNLAAKLVPVITVDNSLATGGTASIANTTPGVDATYRGQGKGVLVDDTTNGKLYINTGTALAPVWTVVGTQV